MDVILNTHSIKNVSKPSLCNVWHCTDDQELELTANKDWFIQTKFVVFSSVFVASPGLSCRMDMIFASSLSYQLMRYFCLLSLHVYFWKILVLYVELSVEIIGLG